VYARNDDFVNQMRSLMRLGAVPYFGRGDYELAPVHADDLAKAVAKSLTLKEANDRVFHVCGPETFTYKEFLKEVKRASGSRAAVVWIPKWAVRTGAFLLGWIPAFPATNAALTMLFEGNTCTEHEWARTFGITPVPLSEGIRNYWRSDGES
jgi:NADH dehydrogenase